MPKVQLPEISIDAISRAEAVETVKKRFENGEPTLIATPYSEFFVYAAANYKFKDALAAADLKLADGVSVLWLARFLAMPLTAKGYYAKIWQSSWQAFCALCEILLRPSKIRSIIPEKIPGSEFFWNLIKLADFEKAKVFLLGGFGETPNIVREKILAQFKNIAAVEFSTENPDNLNLAARIKNFGADFLFVAYGPVRQEIWLAENFAATSAKVGIGVGGTFDYIAGTRAAPPKFIRDIGLEWLYRFATQPKRAKRIWTATFIFVLGAIRYKVFNSMPIRKNVAMVFINHESKILICVRPRWTTKNDFGALANIDHWQFPQGGVDGKETDEQAIRREAGEEVGLKNFQILGESSEKFSYQWHHMLRPLFGNVHRYNGQQQSIYFIKYNGANTDVHIDHREFDDYKWVDKKDLFRLIHPTRHKMLELVMKDIDNYLENGKRSDKTDN